MPILLLVADFRPLTQGEANSSSTVSTKVFQLPQLGHFPKKEGLLYPHCWQIKEDFLFAILVILLYSKKVIVENGDLAVADGFFFWYKSQGNFSFDSVDFLNHAFDFIPNRGLFTRINFTDMQQSFDPG